MKEKLLLVLLVFTNHLLVSQDFKINNFQEGKVLKIIATPTADSQIGLEGMGFCVKHDSNYFLITNRHIVDESDYYTKIPHNQGVSNYLMIFNLTYINYTISNIQIRNDSNELFYGNKYNTRATDIIAIDLGHESLNTKFHPIDLNQNFAPKIGDEVFTISILETQGGIGTFTFFSQIISDTSKDYDSDFGILPIVLIEKPSLPGMSGSPVFVWPNKKKPPVFVGILSGNNNGTGFFWKKKILLDLLDSISN